MAATYLTRSQSKEGYIQQKKGGISRIFILTNPFQYCLSPSVWCVCVLFICSISTSIICVSQEEPSPIASNQQIMTFTNALFLKGKDIMESKFLTSANYSLI